MYLLVLLCAAGALSIVYSTVKNGISPMPSSHLARRSALNALNRYMGGAGLNGIIVEAGSGWGHLAMEAAKRWPHKSVIGLENAWLPYWFSYLFSKLQRFQNLKLLRKDLYTFDYESVDVVLCYLHPGAMKRLSTIWSEKLKDDAVVISIYFAVPGWEPERVITCKDVFRTRIYVYRKPN